MGVRDAIERIYQEQIRSINRRRVGAIAGILAAAAAAIVIVNHHADTQVQCAAYARDQMLEWEKGKRIDELIYTFDALKAMQQKHYEECMK